jgi:L-ascorbate metabolism protein UlaG (beta-lactamase superfamily)
MRCTYLGWAGVEIEHEGATLVIDPLADAAAVFAGLGAAAREAILPEVVPPTSGTAVAGLLTHLHRDHADADALSHALADGAPVLMPDTEASDGPGVAPVLDELSAAGQATLPVSPYQSLTVDPFTVTALPAVDGLGDPQVSWAVAAGDHRILHCGDTMFHGWWWRFVEAAGPFDAVFLPVNGAALNFPFRRPPSPLPAVLTPDQAAAAAGALKAATAVPIHFGAYDLDPYYRSIPDARERFLGLTSQATPLEPGETLELAPRATAGR